MADGDRIVGAGLAAVLFVAHPLRAECVAWASCQTFLPCASFLILSVLAYLRGSAAEGRRRAGWHGAAWVMYAASLSCKGVAVGSPVVLVLLDLDLARRGGMVGRRWGAVLAEKVPFALLGLLFLIRGVVAKRVHGLLDPVAHPGFGSRVAQACYGICFYPLRTFDPTALGAFYPLPPRVDIAEPPFLAAAAVAGGVTAAAFGLRRRYPGLLLAWLGYLVLLAPNLGLVRIGRLLVADRYSYAASLPLAVLAAGGLARVGMGSRWRRAALVGTGVVGVAFLAGSSWRQAATWHDSISLWTQAVAAGGQRDPTLRTYLGVALAREDRLEAAIPQFAAAVDLGPREPEARVNLAMALDRVGRPDEAITQYLTAVRLRPNYPDARIKLGTVLARRGRLREAEEQWDEAARGAGYDADAHNNLGIALGRLGRLDPAIAEFAAAVRLRPADPRFRANLAAARRDRQAGPP